MQLGSAISVLLFSMGASQAATLLTEGFTSVPPAGWLVVNNSTAGGVTSWFQGNPGVFSAQSGPANSYAAANFLAASPGGDISDWLISPVLTFNNGDTVSFYTRTEFNPAIFPDNLQLRLSTSGASTNVGSTTTSVGDFSTLLLAINPLYLASGYPATWTRYVAPLGGLGGATNGRFAFRYVVSNTDVNGDYIGIDTVSVESVPEPGSMTAGVAIMLGAALLRRRKKI